MTQDFDAALQFLGYDPARVHEGFDTLEEIFEYTMSSRYYSRDIYLLRNRNHTARTRDKKRPTYRAFLKYIAERDGGHNASYAKDKSEYLPHIFRNFPHAEREYSDHQFRYQRKARIKKKYNGRLVSEWTGLQGKELGRAMTLFKGMFQDFEQYLDDTPENEIKAKFLELSRTA